MSQAFPTIVKLSLLLGVLASAAFDGAAYAELSRLKVSDCGRYLVTADDQPWFWLGDTAWGLIAKARREDGKDQPALAKYFKVRAAQGFTVLQTVIVSWEDGPHRNAYGHEPFINDDWTRPRIVEGEDNDYWDWVDDVVAMAAAHGIHPVLLPTWLQGVPEEHPLLQDPSVAYRYGHFLGNRYRKEPGIIWVMGGDPWGRGHDVDNPKRLALTRALAEGLADGVQGEDAFDGRADYSTTLMTYHPRGNSHSSSERLHNEPWLDFNMIQTTTRFEFANYETVAADYAKQPPKPTLDAEVAYEDSLSLRQNETQQRRIRPWDSRRAAYWNVFSGSLGHSYGHRSFIRWIRRGETGKFGAHIPWYESLQAPGARQMKHLRTLIESQPMLLRVPDQSLIVGDAGQGNEHARATRAANGSYAFIYLPTGAPVTVKGGKLRGPRVTAQWFDPRAGATRQAGEFSPSESRRFTPPSQGEENDWVLVLTSK